MNGLKIAAIVLVLAGALALAYGGFSYTKDTHEVKLGPMELSVTEKKRVNIPVWAGIGAYRLSSSQTIENIETARRLGADGIVLFSYDSITRAPYGTDYLSSVGRGAFTSAR